MDGSRSRFSSRPRENSHYKTNGQAFAAKRSFGLNLAPDRAAPLTPLAEPSDRIHY